MGRLRRLFALLLVSSWGSYSEAITLGADSKEKCGVSYKAGQGTFWSPGYGTMYNNQIKGPKGYPANIRCTWTITTNPGRYIRFAFFNNFDIEESPYCRLDYVAIYDGIDKSERSLLGRYCGVFQAPLLMSLSDKMTVEFVSDYNNTGNGFLASWITEELEPVNIVETAGRCGGIIEPSNRRLTGEITSMGYPKLDYTNRGACLWEIRLDPTIMQGLTFEIKGMDIEPSPGCRFDQLSIFNRTFISTNKYSKTERVANMCGKGPFVKKFDVLGGKIYVLFATDGANAGKGFKLAYTVIRGKRDMAPLNLYEQYSHVKEAPIETLEPSHAELKVTTTTAAPTTTAKRTTSKPTTIATTTRQRQIAVVKRKPTKRPTRRKPKKPTSKNTSSSTKRPRKDKRKKKKRPSKSKSKCPKTCAVTEKTLKSRKELCANKQFTFVTIRAMKGSSKKGYRYYGQVTESWIKSGSANKSLRRKLLKSKKRIKMSSKCKSCWEGKGIYVFVTDLKKRTKTVAIAPSDSLFKVSGRLAFRKKYIKSCGKYIKN